MNMYYFYKWKSKPMVIINLKSENGNSELRLGEAGYDQLEAPIILLKVIQSAGASLCPSTKIMNLLCVAPASKHKIWVSQVPLRIFKEGTANQGEMAFFMGFGKALSNLSYVSLNPGD